MANENTAGPQRDEAQAGGAQAGSEGASSRPRAVPAPAPTSAGASTATSSKKRRDRSRSNSSAQRIGGSAVPGAKSTLPKPPPTSNNPNQQQMESYNRDMRRRMQRMGTGPYNDEKRMESMQEKRKRRIERRKQRLDEQRQALRKSLPNGGKIALGRRNTYFLIGTVAFVVLLIILFVVLRQLHIIA